MLCEDNLRGFTADSGMRGICAVRTKEVWEK